MVQIRDFIGITVGATLLGGAVFPAIGSAFTGSLAGIGGATQTLVAGGFLGHVAGKAKDHMKFL